MKRFTRDETEHGKEYYLASDVDAAQPAYRAVKTVHEGKPVYVAQQDDDTQGFKPDWADFANGRAAGRAEAFEQIFDKVKSMPWENDTKDSFLIWLQEKNNAA
jgi:hypothetical protein